MVRQVIKRDIFQHLVQELDQTEVTILIGPRQVGKSTLMLELAKTCKRKVVFFDLEDPHTLAGFNLDSGAIIDLLREQKADVIFIDEFHYLKNASKIFKAIYDQGMRDPSLQIKIFASGSSSTEIHKHLKESLAGRRNTLQIFPLNFSEFQLIRNKNSFNNYLQFGGLPGLIHKDSDEEKVKLLKNIVQTYIEKDIKSLIKEENISAFNNLLRILAHRQGQLIELSSLASEIRCSSHTVQRYLDLLAETFVVYSLFSYSRNFSNELKKSKKCYFFDAGIRNLLIENFRTIQDRQDKGCIYEAYVFNFLQSRLLPNMSLKFWRTKQKQEIDFILTKNQIPYPIEIKSHLSKPEIPAAFINFTASYTETTDCFVINENLDLIIDVDKFKVHFVPIEKLEKHQLINDILDTIN